MDPLRFLEHVRAGHLDAVRAALAAAPELASLRVEEREATGRARTTTALHAAGATGDPELVEALLDAGASADVRNGEGRTVLHDAIERSQQALCELLEERGCELDVCAAAGLDRVDLLARWLDRDPDLANDRGTGISPLAWAAYCNASAAAALLLARGALGDDHELACAAACGHAEVAQVLLNAGADPNQTDPASGRTPLHVAAQCRFTRDSSTFVRLLLARGADPTRRDAAGDRPVDVAERLAGRQAAAGYAGWTREFAAVARALAFPAG